VILAGTSGFLDDLAVNRVRDFEAALYKYVDSANPALLRTIMEKKTLDDALKAEMLTVIKEAKQQFDAK
jgi:F-type H+-transporting ATPase subunit alpha